jgi:hypothetical protein
VHGSIGICSEISIEFDAIQLHIIERHVSIERMQSKMSPSSRRMVQVLIRCREFAPFCFTLVSVERPCQPLIYVNEAFKILTQYDEPEVLGKNCRFLQGPETDLTACRSIRKSITERSAVFQDVLESPRPFANGNA